MSYFITNDCIGCALCAKNCPVRAISGEFKQRHSINEKRCVECGVCGKICTKGAIQNEKGRAALRIARTEWETPNFDTSGCSACSICVDVCGFNCISISLPKYKGDLNVYAYLKDAPKCVGCGICAAQCPLKVIEMKGAIKL